MLQNHPDQRWSPKLPLWGGALSQLIRLQLGSKLRRLQRRPKLLGGLEALDAEQWTSLEQFKLWPLSLEQFMVHDALVMSSDW